MEDDRVRDMVDFRFEKVLGFCVRSDVRVQGGYIVI